MSSHTSAQHNGPACIIVDRESIKNLSIKVHLGNYSCDHCGQTFRHLSSRNNHKCEGKMQAAAATRQQQHSLATAAAAAAATGQFNASAAAALAAAQIGVVEGSEPDVSNHRPNHI